MVCCDHQSALEAVLFVRVSVQAGRSHVLKSCAHLRTQNVGKRMQELGKCFTQ